MIFVWLCILALPVLAFGDNWQLQTRNVCFGDKTSQFGTFTIRKSGLLRGITLVQTKVQVPFRNGQENSNRGSADKDGSFVVTTATNEIIFANIIVLENPALTMPVKKGEILRLWNSKDLLNSSDDAKSGRICADVYAHIERAKEIRTSGGNSNGSGCVFPFVYEGTSYSYCIRAGSSRFWCATTGNYENDKRWGNCVVEYQGRTSGGNANGAKCVFPFIYQGTSYSECIGSNQLWCATSSNYDTDQTWGNCGSVYGGYSSWSRWTTCSVSCGGGKQTRTRTCRDTDCSGLGAGQQSRECSTISCAIDGGYSTWSSYSACSEICEGTKTRTRTCTNPLPQDGGKDCSMLGAKEETIPCTSPSCPACYSEKFRIRYVLTGAVYGYARKCYPSQDNAHFIGYGLRRNSEAIQDPIPFLTIDQCVTTCYEKRKRDGAAWNGLFYNIVNKHCSCTKNESGHVMHGKMHLHYVFQ